MRSIQHVPVFEVLMMFCFKGCHQRVEIYYFGLLTDTRFGQLVAAALTAQHGSTTHKVFNSFVLSAILLVLPAF
jgi:hypothetical protein